MDSSTLEIFERESRREGERSLGLLVPNSKDTGDLTSLQALAFTKTVVPIKEIFEMILSLKEGTVLRMVRRSILDNL
jgi:hypothetical protein